MCGNDNDRVRVVVDLERYEELLRKAEHYDNIVDSAMEHASLHSWNDKLDLDMAPVEYYLLVAESGRLAGVRSRLLREREAAQDKAVTVTVKEGEV